MLNDLDMVPELRRQLDVVRQRVDHTIACLAEAKDGLTTDGLEGLPGATVMQGKADPFQLCVRLEVALAESCDTAGKLKRRLKDLAEEEHHNWHPSDICQHGGYDSQYM